LKSIKSGGKKENSGLNPDFLFEVEAIAFMMAGTPVFMRLWRPKRCSGGLHPVGETQNQAFCLSFCSSLKADFQGSQVTSDAGLLLVRELDERLRLDQLIRENLTEWRLGDQAGTESLSFSTA
jgi:hypothetical protein